MNAPWHKQRLAALDFEASDKESETARIVSCALILVGGGLDTNIRTWLVNPGIKQEPGAIAVHKLTDEFLAAKGVPAARGVSDIATAISEVVNSGIPLVGHNLGGFDLNLIDRECRRHCGAGIEEVCGRPLDRVLDTMVLDKHCAPFRRRVSETQGPYQMRTSAERYDIAWDEASAHGAEYDAMQSVRVAFRLGQIAHMPREARPEWVRQLRTSRFDDLAGIDAETLHQRQIQWAAEDAASYQDWLRMKAPAEKRNPNAVIDGSWPLRPFSAAAVTS